MKISKFLKEKYYIIILIVITFIMSNLFLLSIDEVKQVYKDIIYLQLLIMIIIILCFIIEYKIYKDKYKYILEIIENGGFLEEDDIRGNSIEEGIIKNIIKSIKSYNEYDISKYKNSLMDLDEYISKWVHEIKLPISSLNIIIDRMNDIKDSISIKNEVEKINFLVNSILYGSRSTSLFEDIFISKINIDTVVRKAIKNNAFFLIKNNVDVQLKDLKKEVYTDIKWMVYVLDQLINNSIKYSKEDAKIEFFIKSYDYGVVLHIKDYGIGIKKEDLGRIFNKGFTGSNGRDRVYKSTGMGLYFTKKALDKLGHKIDVESENGNYTVFKIYFYNISDYLSVEVHN